MSACFADTYFFLALLNPADEAHAAALDFARGNRVSLVATAWVLTELADGLAEPPLRAGYLHMLDHIRRNPRAEIVPPSPQLFQQGNDLYRERPDKA